VCASFVCRWRRKIEQYVDAEDWAEEDDNKVFIFKRNQLASLRVERKTSSPVALKFLFDEAVRNFLNSYWPCTVADTIFLGG
jgi:hypothetical protein